MEKCNYWKEPHQNIDHVFRDLLPAHGMVERPAQVELSHQMLDTMLNNSIALCDARDRYWKNIRLSGSRGRVSQIQVVHRSTRAAPADLYFQHRTPGCDHPRLPSIPLQSYDG